MQELNKKEGRGGNGRCGGLEIWKERRAFPGFDDNLEI